MVNKNRVKYCLVLAILLLPMGAQSQDWKVNSDYWTATDALGRTTPNQSDVGASRNDKFIAMFYWTWHTDNLADFSPVMNISEILAQHPEAAFDADHAAWNGIWGGVFWWDEPLFGYYRTTDVWVLRKHAEMLADAGVDAVFFDCTNGSYTWETSYTTLLKVWNQARMDGVKTPQIAFMLPFGTTEGSLVSLKQLYQDLYKPELFKDLWFLWKDKPVIMAYPEVLVAKPGDTAGTHFTATESFSSLDVICPSWSNNIGNLTFKLYNWQGYYRTSIASTPIAEHEFIDFQDNQRLTLAFDAQQPGDYVWELSDATETVGVWKFADSKDPAKSYFNGKPTVGNYECRILYDGDSDFTPLSSGTADHVPIQLSEGGDAELMAEIKNFFTFRPGQPDYVNGPSRNDHWGWLENYPQHGYVGSQETGFEQVTVGVSQNARDASGGHCYAFNAPGAYGRSYTQTNGQDTRSDAYLYGANFEEQWSRAFELDPELVFITGWNEWIAGRHEDWPPSNPFKPFAFPDQYDWDKSRDIEPVKSWGDKGDAYYIQLVNNVRRFKGLQKQESASAEKTIEIDSFAGWMDVKPEYWHYKGNTKHRAHKGQGDHLFYQNNSGRNDIVLTKVARDKNYIYFYVETAENLSPTTDSNWMRLFIDIDRNKATGWEGYDFVVNRQSPADSAVVEMSASGWDWTPVGTAAYVIHNNMVVLKVKRSTLKISDVGELDFEFKWSDNSQADGDIMDFYVNGDAAPGGRFSFIYSTSKSTRIGGFNKAPIDFGLSQNFPNPFNPSTTIIFSIPAANKVSLKIYNVAGQLMTTLFDKQLSQGDHRFQWQAANMSSGMYFCKLTSGSFSQTMRMILLQ
jgi:hypothetical protein